MLVNKQQQILADLPCGGIPELGQGRFRLRGSGRRSNRVHGWEAEKPSMRRDIAAFNHEYLEISIRGPAQRIQEPGGRVFDRRRR